ncbi:MAG TPA: SUMF1/EgtB/PvdO family nonheme iron enzyme [Pyrinomonadaceae bacterium]|nr:SUMF1/EgtB/PvdO family nonheme iron enzyme [Pyrinomonadaceae bacterium]
MKECPGCHRCFPDHVNHCPSDGDLLKFTIPGDTVLDERYQLEKRLGQGGMGIVFKARHVFLKTHHAVKVILPDLVGNDPSLVTRFRQEAMAAAAIRHQNTVSVTDYGVIGGTTPFLVMEFIEGHSLHDILNKQKRLSPAQAVEIILAVCSGVAAAHRQGIVHRDLKPLNILLQSGHAPGEGVKVLDFGLAKIKSGELLGSFVAAQTQGMMGSPFYMAPEQWGDEDVDVRSDIYSLGVILYQMLAGDVPFRGVSIPSIMQKHLTTVPVPLSERGVEVPPEVERAVQHALEKDPARRPQTVEEFIEELRAAQCSVTTGDAESAAAAARTVPLAPGETIGLEERRGPSTGGQHSGSPSFETVAGLRADLAPDTSSLEEGSAESLGKATVAQFVEPRTDALDEDARERERAVADTARQEPGDTGARLGGVGQTAPPVHAPGADAMTARLTDGDSQRLAEESRQRAEAERLAAEQRQREESERLRLEAEERQRREVEERLRNEAEALRRQPQGEGAKTTPLTSNVPVTPVQPPGVHVTTVQPPPSSSPSRAPLIALGALLLVGLLAGAGALAFYFWPRGEVVNVNNSNGVPNDNAATPDATPTPGASPTPAPEQRQPDLVALPGGALSIGRDDVPPITPELQRTRATYLLWVYSQWPAREVTVKPFAIDRTEVTNEEYAEFVREEGHAAPPEVWDGGSPRAGQEKFPVSNVSFEDARRFAAWRSKRDGVTYRLPTEEEWEYAARGGDAARVFPWGGEWSAGRANLAGDAPRAVGSFAEGRTPQGVEDMIGNVWEWTSSPAAMYKGNTRTVLLPADRCKLVVRGGSYESRPDGDEPVNAMSRRWFAKDFRSPVLGFRLVRVGP